MIRLLVTFLCMTPLAGLLQSGECLAATSSMASEQAALSGPGPQNTTRAPARVNTSSWQARALGDSTSSLINLFGGNAASGSANNVIGQLIQPFAGKSSEATTTSTTTTTTTPAPLKELGENIQTLGTGLIEAPIKMINTPLKVISNLATGGSNKHDDEGPGVGKQRQKLSEDSEAKYYEYTVALEPFSYRRPKYFSRECPFRFACEVGKLTRDYTKQLSASVETNKFMQDIQNRYTRAMTYGSLYGDCERYYCVLVKFLGGPVGFAGGVAEIVNSALNKEDADGPNPSFFKL